MEARGLTNSKLEIGDPVWWPSTLARVHVGPLVWTSEKDRFTGTFNDERNMITGHSLDDDSNWRPWMDITLTREPS